MKNPLIKAILDSLNDSYNNGTCDNLSIEEEKALLQQLAIIKDTLEFKQDKEFTIEETSQYLGVSRQTINKYVNEGLLTPRKQLGGVIVFKFKEIKELIKKLRQK